MIIKRNGRLIGPNGLPLQQPQAGQGAGGVMGQPQALPPNLLAGGATTNPTNPLTPPTGRMGQPPQQPLRPPMQAPMQGPMQPMQQPGMQAAAGPISNRQFAPQPQPGSSPFQSPMQGGGGNGMGNPILFNPANPTGGGAVSGGNPFAGGGQGGQGGPINLTPGPTPGKAGTGNSILFDPGSFTGGSIGGGGGAAAGSLQRLPSGGGGYGPTKGGGQVTGGNQFDPQGIAQQLQAARDAANAKNEQRYGQQLDLNQSGQQTQLNEQNNSYAALSQMPGRSAQQQQQLLQQARQDQLGAINSSQQKLDTQASQAGNSEASAAKNAYGDLLKNADTRAGKTQNFVDSAYGNLSHTAQQGGAQSMGFLNQQNAGMQGLLNSYSNADYDREKQMRDEQLAKISLDMADRGLSSDTLDQSLKRGVYDDSALRQAEIGDRRLGRSLDVANSYTGRGLGVLGDTNQQQFAAGSAYANAGLNSRQNADSQALNIAGRGVDTSLDAQRSADSARLGIGQSFANQDINARGDLNRTGLNVAADQGAREQSLASQYAGQRQNTLENSNNQRIGIIGARTDQGPSEGDYFGLLSQAGASGRGGGYSGGTTYNPQGGGHIAQGGNPFGDPFNFAGGGSGGYGGGGNPNSNYNPYAQGGGYSETAGTPGLPQGAPNDPLNEGPAQGGELPWWLWGQDSPYGF